MIKIAIMGFGTVGSGVYEILEKNRELINRKLGEDIEVKTILGRRLFSENGISKKIVKEFEKIEEDPEIELVVETMGGTTPAYEYIKRSLLAKKHVVTANKAVVAAHGTELLKIAHECGVNFLFEASVGGGIPIIRGLFSSLAGENIKEISGILNGTTNYILTKMDQEGSEFEDALGAAQEYGYAEREPEADVEGYDTCRKVAILASIATGLEVAYEDIYTEGITKVDKIDFEYAQKMGTSIKLFGGMFIDDGKLYSYVCPMIISSSDPLYMVKSVYNAVMIEGHTLGKTMFYGSGAGKYPTASAVVADVLSVFKKNNGFKPYWSEERAYVEDMDKTSHRYFVRFQGRNEEDIAHCERAFGKSRSVYLEGKDEFAILTGYMREKDFKAVLEGTKGMIKFIRARI